MGYMKKIFCLCSLFPSWSGEGLISTPVYLYKQDYSQCVLTYALMAYVYASVRHIETSPGSVNVCCRSIHHVHIVLDSAL
jgi:hypothetical protein